jgi:hypothetical protein
VKVTLQEGSIVRRGRTIVWQTPRYDLGRAAPFGITHGLLPGDAGNIEKRRGFESRAIFTLLRRGAMLLLELR